MIQVSGSVIETIFEELNRHKDKIQRLELELETLEQENPCIVEFLRGALSDETIDMGLHGKTMAVLCSLIVYKAIKNQLEIQELES